MDLRVLLNVISMSLDWAMAFWPVTVLLTCTAIWGVYKLAHTRKIRSWQALTVLGLVVFPALVVPFYAIQFWANPQVHSPATQELPLNILFGGWILFCVVLVTSIKAARGFRMPLIGIASLVMWLSAGMYLVSIMAVSGLWL